VLQPWRFIYAKRNSPNWEKFLNLLVSGNQIWAKNAAALVVVISHNNFEHNNKQARTHSFDTGAAWENLALQGTINGLAVHGMEGFSYDRAKKELNIPDDYTVQAMIAIGRHGNLENLPPEYQAKDFPSERKPLEEIVFEGTFKK
jgi:nitroreductase